jgi:hypothetical protein
MPLLSAVTREPASCGGPSLFNARALPDRGDPQVASQADYVSHLHLRCATHLPLARHLVTDSLPFPATSCTFSTPPWTLDVHLDRRSLQPLLGTNPFGRLPWRVLRCVSWTATRVARRVWCVIRVAPRWPVGAWEDLNSEVRVRSLFSWAWRLRMLE